MTDVRAAKLGGYAWLLDEPGPKILKEGLSLYGIQETVGTASNPTILDWAKELNLGRIYFDDSVPWCGLYLAIVVKRAGKEPVKDPLWARNWAKWGEHCEPELGCILVFERGPTSGHVGIYVGEDATRYYVLAGNQRDCVCVVPIEKERLIDSRCLYSIAKPDNVRKITLKRSGEVSTNES